MHRQPKRELRFKPSSESVGTSGSGASPASQNTIERTPMPIMIAGIASINGEPFLQHNSKMASARNITYAKTGDLESRWFANVIAASYGLNRKQEGSVCSTSRRQRRQRQKSGGGGGSRISSILSKKSLVAAGSSGDYKELDSII